MADSPWPARTTLLHIYVPVDPGRDVQLLRMVATGQAALAGLPIAAVEPQWLHLTVDQVTRPATLISPDERAALVGELAGRVQRLDPFEVLVGSMLSYHSGVIADVYPDDGLAELYDAVHSAIPAICGSDAGRYPRAVPHLTIGYASAEADSDHVQRLLRRVRPSHAPLTVDAVYLVDVTAAPGRSQTITWEPVVAIPLGAA